MPADLHQTGPSLAGAGILGALLALAALIFFLEPIRRGLGATEEIVAVFPRADRIRPGSEVWLAGHRVGDVTRVEHVPRTADTLAEVVVLLRVPRDLRPEIRSDAYVRFATPRIMGEPAVDVVPGSASAPRLPPGDTLRPRPRPGARAVGQTLREVKAELDSLLASVRSLETALGPGLPARRRMRDVTGPTRRAGAELDALSASLRQGPLQEFLDDPEWRSALDRFGANVSGIAGAFRARAAEFQGNEEHAGAGPALQRLSARADSVASTIGRLREVLAEPAAFPGRASRDSALVKALHGVQIQLDSLIAEAGKNPLRFF